MLRYYLIATAIVVFTGVVVAAIYRGGGHELRVASVRSTGSPSPPRAQARSTATPSAVTGDAPWAMSAVPECFRQRREVHGPSDYVRAALPSGAREIPAGTVVRTADCTLRIGADSVELWRSGEALRIPPRASLYTTAGGDLLLYRSDERGTTLRFYERSTQ